MKYQIVINQLVLANSKLDLIDAAILDFLNTWCSTDDKKTKQITISENNIDYRYTLVNYKTIIQEMPLLQIKSKSAISRRIDKIEKAGFIKTFRAPNGSLYVRLLAKIKDLSYFDHRQERSVPEKKQTSQNETEQIQCQGKTSCQIPQAMLKNNSKSRDIKELVSYFIQLGQNYLGFRPFMDWSSEVPLLSRRMNELPKEKIKELMLWFFESREYKRSNCSLRTILSSWSINKWLSSKG